MLSDEIYVLKDLLSGFSVPGNPNYIRIDNFKTIKLIIIM